MDKSHLFFAFTFLCYFVHRTSGFQDPSNFTQHTSESKLENSESVKSRTLLEPEVLVAANSLGFGYSPYNLGGYSGHYGYFGGHRPYHQRYFNPYLFPGHYGGGSSKHHHHHHQFQAGFYGQYHHGLHGFGFGGYPGFGRFGGVNYY